MKHIKLYENFNTKTIDESMLLKNPGNGIINGFDCKKLYDLSEDQMWNVIKYLDTALVGKKKVTIDQKEYNITSVNVGGCPGGRYETPCNAFTICIDKPMPKNGIFSASKNTLIYFLNNGELLMETAIGAEPKLIWSKGSMTTDYNKWITEIFTLGKKFFDRFKA